MNDSTDQQLPSKHPASLSQRIGLFVGGLVGLCMVWWILDGSFAPNVTEHQPIYPFAMGILIGAALLAFAACTWLGWSIGCGWRRDVDE